MAYCDPYSIRPISDPVQENKSGSLTRYRVVLTTKSGDFFSVRLLVPEAGGTRISRYIYNVTFFPDDTTVYRVGMECWIEWYYGTWFLVPDLSVSSGVTPDCQCCACYTCISQQDAVVGGCSAAPYGAAQEYQIGWGPNPFSDGGGSSAYTTLTYGAPAGCSGSSSSSSSSSSGSGESEGGGCSWYSCPALVCEGDVTGGSSSSSSSSSSGSIVCGVYQLVMTFGGFTDPTTGLDGTGAVVSIVFVSGTDWMGIGG